MNNTTYYQKNRHVILNRAKDYYENDKKRLREQVRDNYINFVKKIKKRENMEETVTVICLKKRNRD